jgi:hypothetical protein
MANLPPGPIADARNIVTPGGKPLSADPQFIEKVRVDQDRRRDPETLATYCRRINDSEH